MDRHEAYSIARRELEDFRLASADELLALVLRQTTRDITGHTGTTYSVETRATWVDSPGRLLKLSVTVNAPSTWRLERLEESVVVPLPGVSALP
jgi:hypothetical protein